jgi:hypothetical protein
MKDKLWYQIQKGLAEPRQPMEDPFKGFRDEQSVRLMEGQEERERRLAAIVQAANELHGRV